MAEKNLQYALMRIWSHWCQFGWNTGAIGVDVNQNVEPLMPIWMSESNTKAIATNSDHNVEPLMPMWIQFQYSECQNALCTIFFMWLVSFNCQKPILTAIQPCTLTSHHPGSSSFLVHKVVSSELSPDGGSWNLSWPYLRLLLPLHKKCRNMPSSLG